MYKYIVQRHRPLIAHTQIRGSGFLNWLKRTGRRLLRRASESVTPKLRPSLGTLPNLFLGDPDEKQESLKRLKDAGKDVLTDVSDEARDILRETGRSILRRIRGGAFNSGNVRYSLNTRTGLTKLEEELRRFNELYNQALFAKSMSMLPGSSELNSEYIEPLTPVRTQIERVNVEPNLLRKEQAMMGIISDHQRDIADLKNNSKLDSSRRSETFKGSGVQYTQRYKNQKEYANNNFKGLFKKVNTKYNDPEDYEISKISSATKLGGMLNNNDVNDNNTGNVTQQTGSVAQQSNFSQAEIDFLRRARALRF